ncbi:MAG: hypothetical protein ACO3P1_10585, partial [Pseudomonadales bacterium]
MFRWRTHIKKPLGLAVKRADRTLLNDEIRVPSVRLIGPDGSQVGVVSRSAALESAR